MKLLKLNDYNVTFSKYVFFFKTTPQQQQRVSIKMCGCHFLHSFDNSKSTQSTAHHLSANVLLQEHMINKWLNKNTATIDLTSNTSQNYLENIK